MRFRHRFRVRAPERLGNGDEMAFTLWAGPVPLRWLARIENASPNGFTDRQVRGPFASWQHQHSFVRVSEAETDVVDQVEAQPKRRPFWRLAGALTWAGMPALFAYRRLADAAAAGSRMMDRVVVSLSPSSGRQGSITDPQLP